MMSDVYNFSSRAAEGDYVVSSNLSESFVTLRIPEEVLREKSANGELFLCPYLISPSPLPFKVISQSPL